MPQGSGRRKSFSFCFSCVCNLLCCGRNKLGHVKWGWGGGVEGISAGWTCGGHAAILSSQTLRKKLVCKLAFPKKRNKTLEPDSCRGFLLCKLFFNTKK